MQTIGVNPSVTKAETIGHILLTLTVVKYLHHDSSIVHRDFWTTGKNSFFTKKNIYNLSYD